MMNIDDYNHMVKHIVQQIFGGSPPKTQTIPKEFEHYIISETEEELNKKLEKNERDLFANISNRDCRTLTQIGGFNFESIEHKKNQYFWLKFGEMAKDFVQKILKDGGVKHNLVRNLAFMRRAFSDVKSGHDIDNLEPNEIAPIGSQIYGSIPPLHLENDDEVNDNGTQGLDSSPNGLFSAAYNYYQEQHHYLIASENFPISETIYNSNQSDERENRWNKNFSLINTTLDSTIAETKSNAAVYRCGSLLVYLDNTLKPNDEISEILSHCLTKIHPRFHQSREHINDNSNIRAIVMSPDEFGGYLVSEIATKGPGLDNLFDNNRTDLQEILLNQHVADESDIEPSVNRLISSLNESFAAAGISRSDSYTSAESAQPFNEFQMITNESPEDTGMSRSESVTSTIPVTFSNEWRTITSENIPNFPSENNPNSTSENNPNSPLEDSKNSHFDIYKNYYAKNNQQLIHIPLGKTSKNVAAGIMNSSTIKIIPNNNHIDEKPKFSEIFVKIDDENKNIHITVPDKHNTNMTKSATLTFEQAGINPENININSPYFKKNIINGLKKYCPDILSVEETKIQTMHYGVSEDIWGPLFDDYIKRINNASHNEEIDTEKFLKQLADFSNLYIQVMPCIAGSSAIGEWLTQSLAASKGINFDLVQQNRISWDFAAFCDLNHDEYFEHFKHYFNLYSNQQLSTTASNHNEKNPNINYDELRKSIAHLKASQVVPQGTSSESEIPEKPNSSNDQGLSKI